MALSASATVLGPGKKRSIARGINMSTAGVTSLDVLTLNHGLGKSPDSVIPYVRSVISTVSAGQGVNPPVVVGWNASVATIHLPAANNGAVEAIIDVVCEVVHSLVK